ncbi:hypothetical protein E4U60_002839 [Claviceps pazoutovae]|uniref:3'-5' exonuclease domain-containing protein n=1 Tax=Claviceps pazoutovae TaxID=1649127 RepID=A0A9P7MB11_9HYPO|nr:hypothetical protein E4U60_002839 [Claviceps pazoutovae]
MSTSTCLHPAIQVVDSPAAILNLLGSIENVPTLYVDLEGCPLSRHGSISILTIYIPSLSTAYIVDVHTMGKFAFIIANAAGVTLKAVLEASQINKVFFDVRNDSDALFHHFQISLQGVQDLQLMELATRGKDRRHVAGLARAIKNDSPISSSEKLKWEQHKKSTNDLFDPQKGGQFEVFNERPFREGILEYCVGDVALLPELYNVYERKLSAVWRQRVRIATVDRVRLSQSASYVPNNRDNALGPW